MHILGLSAFYHDSAAVLLRDGVIVAAAQEERFTRKKHDHRFPTRAIDYCLHEAGIKAQALDLVAFYDKPLLKFERLLETYLAFAPRGFASFRKSMPLWTREKLYLPDQIRRELDHSGKLLFPEHHESHAASAFFPSPFDDAALLVADGVGEWSTTSFGVGEGNRVELTDEIQFPHSIGLLYSAFTYFTGFKVNSGEYKLMGLAPYGRPVYVPQILDRLIELRDDGSFRLNLDYFDYCTGLRMTNDKFAELFGGPAREPESPLTQREMDLAASIQEVTEQAVLRIAKHIRRTTGKTRLCMAGGVALNCVANGRLLRERVFDDLWIQPAAGDAGGALGAAYVAWHHYADRPRGAASARGTRDRQSGSYLGPAYTNDEIEAILRELSAPYRRWSDEDLCAEIAKQIADQKVVGWFQGRMEFGPRALGNRSILGDARSPEMQSVMNLKIKFRESFRPFAPSVAEEHASAWFEIDRPSPYMLLTADVRSEHRLREPEGHAALWGIERLKALRSTVPAITHVDHSARLQTVNREDNPRYHALLEAFRARTGCPMLINTSFNVRGEPIVESPRDAYRCFMRTDIDLLVLENIVLEKSAQPKLAEDSDWRNEFVLD